MTLCLALVVMVSLVGDASGQLLETSRWHGRHPATEITATKLLARMSTTECAEECRKLQRCVQFCYDVTVGACYVIGQSTSSDLVYSGARVSCFHDGNVIIIITISITQFTVLV